MKHTMNTRLLTSWLVLLMVCIVYVKSEWKDPGTPLKSPFAPPEGKRVQVAKNSGNLHRSDTRKHGHSKDKHIHHDPRGDKILSTRRKVSVAVQKSTLPWWFFDSSEMYMKQWEN